MCLYLTYALCVYNIWSCKCLWVYVCDMFGVECVWCVVYIPVLCDVCFHVCYVKYVHRHALYDGDLCTCVHVVICVVCGCALLYVHGVCVAYGCMSIRAHVWGRPSTPALPAWKPSALSLCLLPSHVLLAKEMLRQAGALVWSVIKYTDRPWPILSSGRF